MSRHDEPPPSSGATISWTPFDDGLALDCKNDDKRWKILHAQYTVVAIRRGSAEWRYRRRTVEVGPGSVFVCEPGEVHETLRTDCPGDFTAYFVNQEAIQAVSRACALADSPHFPALGVPRRDLWRAFAELEPSLDAFDAEVFSQRFGALLMQLVQETQAGARRDGVSRTVLDRAWEQLHDEFHSDPTRTVRIRDIAQTQGVSYHSLVRDFSSHFSIAPYQLVKALRAQYAMDQLRRGPHGACASLADVAHECGYSDQAHLARSFRQHWGVTPSALARSVNPLWLQRSSYRPPST